MIRCNISSKKAKIWVRGNGTAEEMMVETSVLIQQLFQNIHRQNPEAARGYKNHLLGMLLDPESPVWKENDHG